MKEWGNSVHYNISRLPFIVAALGALLTSGISGNVANASPSGPLVIEAKKVLCDHGFTYSTPTVLIPNIEGYGWAECDPIPADAGLTHNYYLQLQRRTPDNTWEWVGEAKRSSIIPTSRQTYTTQAPCAPGVYRIYANATGKIQGRDYEYPQVSGQKVVTAAMCGL
ncbi:hypothetical protein [Nocardia sp. NPDC005998]|uniref:hypothetical protein n=1 Tax=Nocardia sp. NPDC005998 TaxID=3156894 RepID=UPI0033AAE981